MSDPANGPEQPLPANWLLRLFEQNQYAALALLCGGAGCLFAAARTGIFAIGFGIAAVCCGSYGVEYVRRQRADAVDPESVPPTHRPAGFGFMLGLVAIALYVSLVSFV